MAAKRLTQSAINWVALAERVPPDQRLQYQAFKSLSDNYMRRVLSKPADPPAIDWAFYKDRVASPGLVDQFEKQYKALQIPYPPNTKTADLDAFEKEIKVDIEAFKKESNARIEEHKKQLAYMESIPPFDNMTMDEAVQYYPELNVDAINNPTFWPHEPGCTWEQEKIDEELRLKQREAEEH